MVLAKSCFRVKLKLLHIKQYTTQTLPNKVAIAMEVQGYSSRLSLGSVVGAKAGCVRADSHGGATRRCSDGACHWNVTGTVIAK